MSENAGYTVDDIHADVSNLFHLLEVIGEKLNQLDYGSGPTRNHNLDRISSLAQLARDSAERLGEQIGQNYATLARRGEPAGAG